MSWVAFAILVYTVAALQTTLAPFVALHTIRPEFLVIVAVHYALWARREDAAIAGWIIGLVADLASAGYWEHSHVGMNAVTYAAAVWLIVRAREHTFRESVLTRLFFTFSAALVLTAVGGFYVYRDAGRTGEVLGAAFWTAIYTAILAPYGLWLLHQMRTALGVGLPSRQRMR